MEHSISIVMLVRLPLPTDSLRWYWTISVLRKFHIRLLATKLRYRLICNSVSNNGCRSNIEFVESATDRYWPNPILRRTFVADAFAPHAAIAIGLTHECLRNFSPSQSGKPMKKI